MIGESNVYIDVAGNMSMEQTHLCGLWKRWRRSSINNRRSLSPKKMPSKKRNNLSRCRAPIIYNQPGPTPVNTSEGALDAKGCIQMQACSAGRCHRYISGSRKAYDSIVDDIVDDLLPRRYSSHSQKTFAPTLGASDLKNDRAFHLKSDILPRQKPRPNPNKKPSDISPSESRVTKWLRRCADSNYPRQRRSSVAPYAHENAPLQIEHCQAPIPGIGIEPPIIPDDPTSGAAARAAAATQNEILEFARNLKLVEVRMDTESGIGIEMQNKSEETINAPIARKDPLAVLPEELVEHILSYLDAVSLIEAELVSHRWHHSASSHHVWKQIFHEEFGYPNHNATVKSTQAQFSSTGLGKVLPEQDWKTMWRARKSLNQRWQDGHAAAIYLEGHTDSIYCVQFDEHKIVTGSRDCTIRVWDAHTYECTTVLGCPSRNLGVVVPPIPSNLVTGRGVAPFMKVISSFTSPEPTYDLSGLYHTGSVLCLQYHDSIMITGSSDCTCIVWDITACYKPIRRLRHHTAGVLDVCLDSKYIVTCSKDTTVCLWDQTTGDLLRKLSGHRGPVNAVQMRGDLLVSASGDGVAKLWNLTSGLCIKEFPSKDRGMACVEFSPDARTILAGGNDQVIYQFDSSNGELVREFDGHNGLVRSLHLDTRNGRVVSGSYDHSVKVWDLATGKNTADFMGWATSWILSAKADYRRIVATSQDSRAVVMDFGYQLNGVELLEG